MDLSTRRVRHAQKYYAGTQNLYRQRHWAEPDRRTEQRRAGRCVEVPVHMYEPAPTTRGSCEARPLDCRAAVKGPRD